MGSSESGLVLKLSTYRRLTHRQKPLGSQQKLVHSVTCFVEEGDLHAVEYRPLDTQLHQGRHTIDGFMGIHGLWIELDSFDLRVRVHHDGAPLGKREPSIRKRAAQMKMGLWSAYHVCRCR